MKVKDIIITDEVLIEELKKRFEEKETSLKELKSITDELRELNNKLTESEALKSHFISNITNEIVNPFTSIVVLSKNILSVKEGEWSKVKRMAELIHAEAFGLDFQLKNIFVAAEVEAGELNIEISNVNIDSLVESLMSSYKPVLSSKNLKFEYIKGNNEDEECVFKTDAEKIKLILSNLVDNAVKFSENNKIIIKRFVKDKKLHISVQDFGTGISAYNQKVIFDRFKRLDTGINSINRGHGLGLSINKALLDFLEGEIFIDTKISNGTTFSVVLPEHENSTDAFSNDGNELIFGDDELF